MSKPETMMIDDVKCVKEDYSVPKIPNIVYEGDKTIASTMIGKKVLVRSRNEGINAGIVVLADETGVLLKECRRLWYHKPKNSNMSWYEGVAISGISDDSKISGTVPEKCIIESYSLTTCTDEAFKSIMESENVKS